MSTPYLDIHSHSPYEREGVVVVQSLGTESFPSELPKTVAPFCLGIHPWWAETTDLEQALEEMKKAFARENCFSLGEMGLDRVRPVDWKKQLDVFGSQLKLARELSAKSVIIHCVRAFSDIIHEVKTAKYEGAHIFHDYNGGPEITKDLLKRPSFFSYGRHLFSEKNQGFKSFELIPLEKLFFETDDWPEMTIENIYQQAEGLKKIATKDLLDACFNNYKLLI
jgi:TatD DNase family protein